MVKIKIGRVTGAQGLHGEIKLHHDSGDEEALRRLSFLFLHNESVAKTLCIESLRFQKRTPILKLAGINDRNAAEALAGFDVYADESESRPDEEGVWLASDLKGLEVRLVTESGAAVSGEAAAGKKRYRVRGIIDNPAHDILEIETDKGTRLLPFVDVFVREIDTKTGYIAIMPPEGWLE